MPQWVWLVALLVGYVVLTQWLLPKLGVPTWRSAGCVESRRKNADEPNTPVKAALSKKHWPLRQPPSPWFSSRSTWL